MTNAYPESGALRLLTKVLQQYSSLDAFLMQVRRELDDPTVVLPRIVENPSGELSTPDTDLPGGRHARADD
ncbi:hypothetical protein ACWDOP_01580 [Nocardia sp. NPDC003693]